MKRIAVYAGTFDPPTKGHIDIVRRVQPLFDKIFVLVAENPRKTTLFNAVERKDLFQKALEGEIKSQTFEVCVHSGLIVDFCKKMGAQILIRGLRAISDFEAELQMSSMNRLLDPGIETMHIMTDEKYFFVSSTLIKEVAQYGGSLSTLVTENVEKALKERFK